MAINSLSKLLRSKKVSWKHALALNWFVENQGQEIAWADIKMPDGTLLSCIPKGIYKPAWSPRFALSVKKMQDSQYDDQVRSSGGIWRCRYHKENLHDGRKSFPNKALNEARQEGVPIGFLEQTGKGLYLVRGLASIDDFDGNYFHLTGIKIFTDVNDPLTSYSKIQQMAFTEFPAGFLSNGSSSREIQYRLLRKGQPKLRKDLLGIYGCCAITGCRVKEVLEAAHIIPHREIQECTVENAILLRADIHCLFDDHLLTICSETNKIIIHSSLKETSYFKFHGKDALWKKKPKISVKALANHNLRFRGFAQ